MKATKPNEASPLVAASLPVRRFPVSLLFAALVCSPYAGLLVPYQHSVQAQFLAICLVLGVAKLLSAEGLRSAWMVTPSSIRLGLALYGGAAVWGLVVGIVHGNSLRYVLSQGAAMLLLPAGAMAFAGLRRASADSLVNGFSWAAILAVTIQLGAVLSPALRSYWANNSYRFEFVEGATATGATVLLVLILLGATLRRPAWLSILGLIAAVVLLVGARSRGAWLCVGVGALVLATLVFNDSIARKRLFVMAILAGLGLVGLVSLGSWRPVPLTLEAFNRPLTLTSPGTGVRHVHSPLSTSQDFGSEIIHRVAVHGAAMEVQVDGFLSGSSHGLFHVWWVDRKGEVVRRSRILWRAPAGPTQLRATIARPDRGVAAQVAIDIHPGSGDLRVDRVRVLSYPYALEFWAQQVLRRVTVSAHYIEGHGAAPNLAYRERENRAVLREWRTSPLSRLLTGQGLGKMFDFPNSAWSASGHRITIPRASYIHDFYLFLAFKLGLAGLAALCGLVTIVVWTFRRALAGRRSGYANWLLAASASGWLAYLIWSVTSPEIYDFRMAPIWGALIVTSVRTAREGELEEPHEPSPWPGARRDARRETMRPRDLGGGPNS